MHATYAIIGASGKLGNATLKALLSENLAPAENIVCCTTSQPGSEIWSGLAATGAQVRYASFEDRSSIEKALIGVDKLFLVSTPKIEMDFNDAPPGTGRERAHITAIEAAKAAGVAHIYYSSLAFASPSHSGVMRAHIRTEKYLSEMSGCRYTVLREGLYNESWPLYLGYYDVKHDQREEVPIGGDGLISWTAISDLGLASALILTSPSADYAGKTLYLSATKAPKSLEDVAAIVAAVKGKQVRTKVVSRGDHEKYYIEERKMPEDAVKWWSTTYDSLRDQECHIHDTTLETLLSAKGREPISIETTIRDMILG